jgi:uncharacterized protein
VKFTVDTNVSRLTMLLRLLGYDAVFFSGRDDGQMISRAFVEHRVILTRDTHIPRWGVVLRGEVKAVLISSDDAESRFRQVVRELGLRRDGAFSLCLQCNATLVGIAREEARGRVPPFVFQTQQQFFECPVCHRLYWRGTHWADLVKKLGRVLA